MSSTSPASTAPTRDSFKMPLVQVAFGRATSEAGRDELTASIFNRVRVPLVQSPDVFLVPASEAVLSFNYGLTEDSAWTAEITLFDPTFTGILSRIAAARGDALSTHVYFRFGWFVDGSTALMSPTRRGAVLSYEPEFAADGCTTVLSLAAPETVLRMSNKVHMHFAPGTPLHSIVRALVEETGEEDSKLSDSSQPLPARDGADAIAALTNNPRRLPRVRVDTELQPFFNNGQPITCNEPVFSYIKSVLAKNAVPSNPSLAKERVRFYESEGEPGVYVLTTAPPGGPIERDYVVGRSMSAQVIDFRVSDSSILSSMLGGAGYSTSPMADKAAGVPLATKGDPQRAGTQQDTYTTESVKHVREGHAITLETLAQQRQAAWNLMAYGTVRADMELVGDPTIKLNDYVNVTVMQGGSHSVSGQYKDSVYGERTLTLYEDGPENNQEVVRLRKLKDPSPITFLSGQYLVTGYTHKIEPGSSFTTSLVLVKVAQSDAMASQSQEKMPASSGKALWTAHAEWLARASAVVKNSEVSRQPADLTEASQL